MVPRFKIQLDRYDTLCATCHHGQVTERRNGQTTAFCNNLMRPVLMPLDVSRCSEYNDKRLTDRHDLEKIAWRVSHDKEGVITGFAPPKPKKQDDD